MHDPKLRHVLLLALFVACLPPMALANQDGISSVSGPMVNGLATCSGALCHSTLDPDPTVEVTISGPSVLAPGESAVYVLSIDPVLIGAGMNASLLVGGVLTAFDEAALEDESTALLDGEVTHQTGLNFPGGPGVGKWDYLLRVTAPDEPTTLTLNVAMNAFNQSFSRLGDRWNRAELEIVVEEPAAVTFTDIAFSTGVGVENLLTESLAWGDYDGDGDQDLFLSRDGPNQLFRNDGGGSFSEVAAVAGVAGNSWSVGSAFGDLDNDGDLDLYVVTFMDGAAFDNLYRNDGPIGAGGETVFSDIAAEAGITFDRSSRGVALFDYDRDGRLDVYVNAIGDDLVYHNLGDLSFAEVAAQIGVTGVGGQGVGVVATDIDNDGWIDLFTGNRSGDPNRLFVNDEGSFVDITTEAGIDKVGLGMGVHSFDYDNDLDLDLYWTSWPAQANELYENLGDETFASVASTSGTLDSAGWGISNNAGDVDNDGFLDMYVTNGFDPATTPNLLLRNAGDGTFEDLSAAVGGGDFDGRGVAFADYDMDGDLDLVVTAGPFNDASGAAFNEFWRNDTSNDNAWVVLELEGTFSNRSAIGSRVEVQTDLGTTVQEVSGGAGRGSFNSLPLEFGLGAASEIQQVTVRWPSGSSEPFGPLAIDQYHLLVETVPEPSSTLMTLAGLSTLLWLSKRSRG